MQIACRESEQTEEKYNGGNSNVCKGEYRGRPVAIKVVRICVTNNREKCLSVRTFDHLGNDLLLNLLLVEVL